MAAGVTFGAPRSPWPYVLLVVAMGVAGATAATRNGVGVTPDSVTYLDAARHLLTGDGYVSTRFCAVGTAPVVRFPPGYPMLLAAVAALGVSPLDAARVLSLIFLGVNAFLIAAVAHHIVRGSFYAPIAAAFFMAASPVALEIHSAAWSEPMFLCFIIAGLFVLQLYVEQPSWRLLLGASGMFAAACVTRYMGISVVLAAGLVLLFNRQASRRRRWFDTLLAALVSLSPVAAFMLRNWLETGAAINKTLAWNWSASGNVQAVLVTLGAWLVPGSDRFVYVAFQDVLLALVVGALLIAAGVWRGVPDKARNGDPEVRRPFVFEVFVVAYVVTLLGAVGLGWRTTPVDNRLLSPIFPALVVIAIHRGISLRSAFAGAYRLLPATCAVGLAAAYAVAGGFVVVQLSAHGRGYTTARWQLATLLEAIGRLEDDRVIYCDDPLALQFLTGKAACPLQGVGESATEWREELRQRVGDEEFALVRFNRRRRFAPRLKAAQRRGREIVDLHDLDGIELQLIVNDDGAELYRARLR